MPRLSLPLNQLENHYTVVVIGSGYGGAIAASRLARAGQKVCVLERGREFQPGEYPDSLPEMIAEVQIDSPRALLGNRTALYDLKVNDDINVFSGCGLGGTSLVNANVSLEAEPRVLEDPRWPAAFRADAPTLLQQSYARARDMLKPLPYPPGAPPLAKLEALEASANSLGQPFYRPPINVTFQDGVNHVGVEQKACALCGDCVSGCNHSAKNTVLMNYLPDAANHGAAIFTQLGVRRLERKDGKWFVHYQFLDSGREKFSAPTLFLTADIVILAAGVLGTAEILLRSRRRRLLPLSSQLGEHFTGNGDVLGFSYNGDKPVHGIGFGDRAAAGRTPVGPCISGIVDIREQSSLEDGMVIEEGSIPGAVGALIGPGLASAAPWAEQNLPPGPGEFFAERNRETETLFHGPYRGAVDHTQTYLVMSHDDGAGRLVLEDDRVRILWPGVGKQPGITKVNDTLKAATIPLGGVYLKNRLWSESFNNTLTTVHPLGGCVMAEDASSGVVNHKGQVFSGPAGPGVHDGLYVCDGSVIPRSLGVNPLLTISAVAERTCALLAADRGWNIDYTFHPPPPRPATPLKTGMRFTETMRGFFSRHETQDFQAGETRGRQEDSPFEFTLTIVSDDLEEMLANPGHHARMAGTATAPALSPLPLTVSHGTFQLLARDPSQVNARLMLYRMTLTSEDGQSFEFEGFKAVKADKPANLLEIWPDTSTLFITLSAAGAVIGKGILHILPADFLRQMTTMVVTNAPTPKARLDGLMRFGMFFAGQVFQVYGGVIGRANEFQPNPIPRKKRPLRAPAPEVHFVETEDHTVVRLTRFRGGSKGPVLVTPGYGTSTLAFSTDTIDTNLPEFLCAAGYDVWLFDYRASPELPSARTQFTLDDIATKDYPAAAAFVRQATGASTIQVLAHCIGSMTFLMAMLSGKLTGVRSAICSQLTFFPVSPPENKLKAAFNIGEFLKALGVTTVTTDISPDNWRDLIADAVLKLNVNGPPCNSAVCRRIWTIFGPSYDHAQLNDATHSAIHEMFGVANVTAFNHILETIRKGHIVDKDGNDVYLPHIARLKFPITFLHGAKNKLFLPEGSERTFNLLNQKNGGGDYRRIVLANYAHMDFFVGKNAASDVFPLVLGELDEYQ